MHEDFQPGNAKRRNHLKHTGIDGKKKWGKGVGSIRF
jgi:hypothetical protein